GLCQKLRRWKNPSVLAYRWTRACLNQARSVRPGRIRPFSRESRECEGKENRMRRERFGICTAIALWVIGGCAQAAAQTVRLSGTVSPEALKLPTYGDLPATRSLPLQIWFRPRNQAQLNALLAAQQDPGSPKYHQWLKPQEYAGRFGVSQQEFNQISHWLTG